MYCWQTNWSLRRATVRDRTSVFVKTCLHDFPGEKPSNTQQNTVTPTTPIATKEVKTESGDQQSTALAKGDRIGEAGAAQLDYVPPPPKTSRT